MSAANFAPYKPSPDEERLGGMASGSSATAGSSAATSPKPSQAIRAPLLGSASTSAQNNSKLDRALGRSSLERGYRDDDEDASYDARYATESYQSSTPRAQQSYSSNGRIGVGATSFSSDDPYQSSPSANKPAWSNGSSVPPVTASYGFGNGQRGQVDSASYSTSQGFNLSNLCFAAWALPPFSSVLLLIYETENDLVRFHAYQAGMFGIGSVVLLWILRSWFGWYAISIIAGMASLGYAWICGSNAANAAPTLTRTPCLPALGPLAEQWLGEE